MRGLIRFELNKGIQFPNVAESNRVSIFSAPLAIAVKVEPPPDGGVREPPRRSEGTDWRVPERRYFKAIPRGVYVCGGPQQRLFLEPTTPI